ncbi:MAG: heavy-metal-associated domain-containing protein [Gaiellales bacterium]
MDKLEVRVTGMSCSHCEAAVREEVGQVAGVERVEADATTGCVTVEGVALDRPAIEAAVVEAGYTPEP